MYTPEDRFAIDRRVRKVASALGLGLIPLLAAYVWGMVSRRRALVMLDACAIFMFTCFMILEYLVPCLKYRAFLKGLDAGLRREMTGRVASVSDEATVQDGVRVFPVHLALPDGDERILYVNCDKVGLFAPAGESVRLTCQGRHILEWEASE